MGCGRTLDGTARCLLRGDDLSRRRQAQGRVEGDHRDGRWNRAGRSIEVRTSKCQRQQQERADAQREQDQLSEPTAPLPLDGRLLQQPHRREFHDEVGSATEQVENDWNRNRQPAQEKKWIEERQWCLKMTVVSSSGRTSARFQEGPTCPA